jgi:hypothetical protein
MTPRLPTETIQFVDMSDPKNAKNVKTFEGVTSVYPDDGRKLVYLTNGDGIVDWQPPPDSPVAIVQFRIGFDASAGLPVSRARSAFSFRDDEF